jgi:CheY-like chemotaxis protein
VEVEAHAGSALARLSAGERFDAIICDLMMPDMTGMDFQREVEQRAPALSNRTIFMTGGAFTPRAHSFLERLGDRCLSKPFNIDEIERLIGRALRS